MNPSMQRLATLHELRFNGIPIKIDTKCDDNTLEFWQGGKCVARVVNIGTSEFKPANGTAKALGLLKG